MNALRNEAIEKFALIDARLVHRIGTVKGGDNIVFIAAGAEHRAAAFDACRLADRRAQGAGADLEKRDYPRGGLVGRSASVKK